MEEKEHIEETTASRTSALEVFSRILSAVFNPLLTPLYVFILLFQFTYMAIMPPAYKLFLLGIVATFTLLSPLLFIGIYKWINKWNMKELSERKRRFVPYLLTMMSFATCLLILYRMNFPYYFSGIITAFLLSMTVCALANFRWRFSVHLTGCGLLVGGLLAYSLLFQFNPVWWLCGFILLAGIQGTARISLHQHTLLEVIAGFVAGMFCGIIGILFI